MEMWAKVDQTHSTNLHLNHTEVFRLPSVNVHCIWRMRIESLCPLGPDFARSSCVGYAAVAGLKRAMALVFVYNPNAVPGVLAISCATQSELTQHTNSAGSSPGGGNRCEARFLPVRVLLSQQ